MNRPDIKKVMELIYSGEWLALRFITADIRLGKGGKVIELPKARLSRKAAAAKKIKAAAPPVTYSKNSRYPNHHQNFTVNLELPNQQIVKVHPPLVTHINNIAVL